MSKRFYFGKTPYADESRNNYLVKNRKLLKIVLHREWTSKAKQFGHHDNYVQTILKYMHKVEDSRRNSFNIKEIKEIIHILEKPLNHDKGINAIPDSDLVDYMYSLTKEYIKKYEEEQGLSKRLSGTGWQIANDILEDKPQEKPKKINILLKKYQRNNELAEKAIKIACFQCEFDETHLSFKSARTNKNYVEAHHLIPFQFQNEFNVSLDVLPNILSLCVLCHKKLHYGLFEDKKEILINLLELRKSRLRSCGLDIDEEKLFSFYLTNLNDDI